MDVSEIIAANSRENPVYFTFTAKREREQEQVITPVLGTPLTASTPTSPFAPASTRPASMTSPASSSASKVRSPTQQIISDPDLMATLTASDLEAKQIWKEQVNALNKSLDVPKEKDNKGPASKLRKKYSLKKLLPWKDGGSGANSVNKSNTPTRTTRHDVASCEFGFSVNLLKNPLQQQPPLMRSRSMGHENICYENSAGPPLVFKSNSVNHSSSRNGVTAQAEDNFTPASAFFKNGQAEHLDKVGETSMSQKISPDFANFDNCHSLSPIPKSPTTANASILTPSAPGAPTLSSPSRKRPTTLNLTDSLQKIYNGNALSSPSPKESHFEDGNHNYVNLGNSTVEDYVNAMMAPTSNMTSNLASRPPLPPNRNSSSLLSKEDDIKIRHLRRSPTSPTPPIPTTNSNNSSTSSLPRPHVIHKQCKYNADTNAIYKTDVAIVFSEKCETSCKWAEYLKSVLLDYGRRKIAMQEVEVLSRLSTKPQDSDGIARLKDIEEQVFHASAQIVIVGQSFLDWVYSHPGLLVGNLFSDPTKVIGLLLGITADAIKSEHRAELLTFAVWKHIYPIKSNDTENLMNSVKKAVASMTSPATPTTPSPPVISSYVEPKPLLKKFRIWPPCKSVTLQHDKIMLMLSCPVASIEANRVEISLDLMKTTSDSHPKRIVLDRSKWRLVRSDVLEVAFPMNVIFVSEAKLARLRLEIGKVRWFPEVGDDDNSSLVSLETQVSRTSLDMTQLEAVLVNFIKNDFVDKNVECPSIIHFAAKHGMKQLAEAALSLPGGHDVATVSNDNGLNARDLALSSGHIDMAKMLKKEEPPQNRNQLHDYEYPLLRPPSLFPRSEANTASMMSELSIRSEPPAASNKTNSTGDYFYDVPRSAEAAYVIPPPPRPIEAKKTSRPLLEVAKPKKADSSSASSSSYISMHPRSNSNNEAANKKVVEDMRKRSVSLDAGMTPSSEVTATTKNNNAIVDDRPQSRQEFISSLVSSSSIEDIPEQNMSRPLPTANKSRSLKLDLAPTTTTTTTKEHHSGSETAEVKSPLSIVNGFAPTFIDYENVRSPTEKIPEESEEWTIYEKTQAELVDIQTRFKAGEVSLSEVEESFAAWKSSPEVAKAENTNKLEVDAMKREWEAIQDELRSAAKESGDNNNMWDFIKGSLRRNKNRKKSTSDLMAATAATSATSPLKEMKYSTLPSLPLRKRRMRSKSRSSTDNGQDQHQHQLTEATSVSSVASSIADTNSKSSNANINAGTPRAVRNSLGNFSDSSWSAETTASALDFISMTSTEAANVEEEIANKNVNNNEAVATNGGGAYDNVILQK